MLAKRRAGIDDWAEVFEAYKELGGKERFIVLMLPNGRARYLGRYGKDYRYELTNGKVGSVTALEFKTSKKLFKKIKERKTWQESR